MLCGAHPHHKNNLCASCMNDIPWNINACITCAEYVGPYVFEEDMVCANCQQKPPLCKTTICALHYLAPIDGLMNKFKHERNLAAGRLLTGCLCQAVMEAIMQGRITMPQLLIPVPLNSLRLRKRGFNQAQFIAKGLSHLLNVNVNTRLCKRKGYQVPQQSQTRWQRQSSLRGVFQVKKSEVNRGTNHIAIIDDVMTTGATTQALSQSLVKAWNGPLEIQVWCIARTQSFNTKLDW